MRVVMFYHSLVSDWNHGNAHFLRGIASELQSRGHEVRIFEPERSWSRENLLQEHGTEAVTSFARAYPALSSTTYELATLDLDRELEGADLVLVHEWNDHALVDAIGRHRGGGREYRLFFHDTHHRSVTDPASMAAYQLENYDGVLAFGEVIRQRYLRERWARRVWTWHEAADVRVFYPRSSDQIRGDVIWVGNWGDEERTAELEKFLIQPIEQLRLKARVHGVRYPPSAIGRLAGAGIDYAGWLPNYRVPEAFANYRITLHIPRRPYVQALPGIPTIRVFEALACGIPLICAPWRDDEHLFAPGADYLTARDGGEMRDHLEMLLSDPPLARRLAEHGHRTILARHTCAHRVDELMGILGELNGDEAVSAAAETVTGGEVPS
jgi:spore maturation protein CgeB